MDVLNSTLDKGLPQHIWKKVFSYIPKKFRTNIPLVNSHFYEITCDLEEYERELEITKENLDDEWIMRSKRKIRTIRFTGISITETNMILMTIILSKYGAKVETLHIWNYDNSPHINISAYRLLSLLEVVPHLKKLEWDVTNVNFVKWYSHEPVLKELESLTLNTNRNLCIEFAAMFTPNTIKSLAINGTWNQLGRFLLRQTSSLKDFKLNTDDGAQYDANIFKDIQLDSFAFYYHHAFNDAADNFILQLLSHHQELKSVNSIDDCSEGGISLGTEIMAAICDIENLENLEVAVFDENTFRRQISRLQNLKKVKIVATEQGTELIDLATIQLDKLEDMNLRADLGVSTFFIETAGLNWPNLKCLVIEFGSRQDSVDILNVFLDSFPRLEQLSIQLTEGFDTDEDDSQKSNVHALIFYHRFQQYPYLKSLEIVNAKISQFQDMLISLPNLECLKLYEYEETISYSPHILHLMAQLHKLKDLYLNFTVESKNVRFSNQEAALLKDLCRRLEAFEIIIIAPTIFEQLLLEQIENCSHYITEVRRCNQITLKNVVY